MNILLYQWKAYHQDDVQKILLQLGHRVELLTNPIINPEEEPEYVERLVSRLRVESYDFLLSINYFPVLSESCKIAGIPYVSWTCDSPLIAMHHNSIFHSGNYLFLFDQTDYEMFRSFGLQHIYYLPLGTPFSSSDIMQKTDPRYYDVSFVGSLYEKNSYDQIAPKLPPFLAGYLECALEAQMQIAGGNLFYRLLTPEICTELESITQYQKATDSFSDLRLLFATTILGFKAASLQRCRTLNKLSLALRQQKAESTTVHLFTNDRASTLPLVDRHGPVDYHSEMPEIFHQSKINLNFTIPNIQTGLPLRIWDVLGSCGFLLTNAQAEISNFLEAGTDLETFESTEECIEKVIFYLQHEEARSRIARHGFQTVRANHTCRHRLEKLLSIIKNEI